MKVLMQTKKGGILSEIPRLFQNMGSVVKSEGFFGLFYSLRVVIDKSIFGIISRCYTYGYTYDLLDYIRQSNGIKLDDVAALYTKVFLSTSAMAIITNPTVFRLSGHRLGLLCSTSSQRRCRVNL
jgi:hypothetical protein